MQFLRRLLSRVNRKRPSSTERAEGDAQKSARKYWEREVHDEQERRGHADPRRKG
jgi:hypothetical protein